MLLGAGDGTFALGSVIEAGNGALKAKAVADVNEDGWPDVLVTDREDRHIVVLLGTGDGALGPRRTFPAGVGSIGGLSVADFDDDGHLDVVTNTRVSSLPHTGAVSVLRGNGDGTFEPPIETPLQEPTQTLAVADLNRDRRPDVVTGSFEHVVVLFGKGDGTFAEPVSVVADPSSVALGDVNGDLNLDLIDKDGALLGRGDGTFGPWISATLGGTDLGLGELTGDGHLDLVRLEDRALSVLAGRGDGTFGPPQSFAAGASNPSTFLLEDLNGDGALDAVVADFYDHISVLLASPIRRARLCTTDCDGDGTVEIHELIRSVNIALGEASVATCVLADESADGQVTVDELVHGVNNALGGCPTSSAAQTLSVAGAGAH